MQILRQVSDLPSRREEHGTTRKHASKAQFAELSTNLRRSLSLLRKVIFSCSRTR